MKAELEQRYRLLAEQYVKLLQDWLAQPEADRQLPPLLPPFPLAVVREACPLSADPGLAQLLVSPGRRPAGLRELRDFTAEVKRLTILDPFFFAGPSHLASEVASDFLKTARAGQGHLKTVHIVRDQAQDTKAVVTAVKKALASAGVRFTCSSSSEMHDRVWIADGERAVVVGTSFNGIGSRAAFILELSSADLAAILEFLRDRHLDHRSAARPTR